MICGAWKPNWAWTYDNYGTNPASTPGTSITPGASNAEGTFTQIASSANIAQEVSAIFLRVHGGATSANQKDHLLDIGVDPAGGTSYTAVISNIVCGASGTILAMPARAFLFPLRIPSGSSVAARIQGNNATAGTVRVAAKFFGQGRYPLAWPPGSFSETIGTITNSQGVSFTPGNAADGTWTSLGTTTNPMWWWQLCVQVSNASTTAEYCYVDLAYGDGSNKHIITRMQHGSDGSEREGDMLFSGMVMHQCFCPVPAGSTLYVRGRADSAPDTGYNAVAVGIG